MLTNSILLQAQDGGYGSIFMIVALIAVFYFFMIRPQQKQRKQIQKFRDGLKAGDEVITAGGIHGKIRNVNKTTLQLEIADGVKIIIEKNSVYASGADAAQAAQENDTQK